MPSSISERLEKQSSTIKNNNNKIVDNNNKIDSLNYLAGFYKLLQNSVDNGLRVSRPLARIEPMNEIEIKDDENNKMQSKIDKARSFGRTISETTLKQSKNSPFNMILEPLGAFGVAFKNGGKSKL